MEHCKLLHVKTIRIECILSEEELLLIQQARRMLYPANPESQIQTMAAHSLLLVYGARQVVGMQLLAEASAADSYLSPDIEPPLGVPAVLPVGPLPAGYSLI